MVQASCRGTGKEVGETQITALGWAERAKENAEGRPLYKLERGGQAPRTFRWTGSAGVKSPRFWVGFCGPLGRGLSSPYAGSEVTC